MYLNKVTLCFVRLFFLRSIYISPGSKNKVVVRPVVRYQEVST